MELNEVVRLYTDDETGDFVRCSDCGCVQLIQLGGTACGECQGENLAWASEDRNLNEMTVDDLEKLGYIVETI